MRLARIAILIAAVVPATAQSALAQCVLGPVTAAGGFLSTPAARYAQALTYADHQCLTEAESLLSVAATDLASQTGDRAAVLRNLVASAREYVHAIAALHRGEREAGYASLQRIIERGINVVSVRAALELGTAIVHAADDPRWRFVEEILHELSRRGDVRADFLLVERRIDVNGIDTAIAALAERLHDEKDVQRALSLQLFLIELYARAGRLIDAQLLLVALERDAADTLLDLEMRKRLLTVGVAVSNALVSQGRREFSGYQDAYSRALADIKRFAP
jgi:hypothetical protein